MENQSNQKLPQSETINKNSYKTLIKGALIVVLSLFLLIAVPFILSLTSERSINKVEVIQEISSKWGGNQIIYGPFIQITSKVQDFNEQKKPIWRKQVKMVFPENMKIDGEIKTTVKKRSIYEAILYQSDLNIKTDFEDIGTMFKNLKIDPETVLNTKVVFGVTDDKGLTESLIVKNNGQKYEFLYDKSVNIVVSKEYSRNQVNFMSFEFSPNNFNLSEISIPLKLKGAEELYFVPTAKNTKVSLKSDWEDIKYDGNYLPEQRDSLDMTTNKTTNWNIFQSNPLRSKYWEVENDFDSFKFGIEFLMMNDNYAKVDRSVKYAILFIGLTFITFFFAENRNNLKIHLVHYALVGIALCVNFVLLLSISEYLGFNMAYLISSTATILLIVSFIHGLAKQKKVSLAIFGVLTLLYIFIYTILQLKEQALLVGSIGIFIIIAILMQFSKKINWN